MKNYYQILGINRKSSKSEIKSAFRKLAKKYHPDINKSNESTAKFIDIYEAYEILSNDEKRKIFDELFFEKEQLIKVDKNYSDAQRNYDFNRSKAKSNAEYYSKKHFKDFIQDVFIKAFINLLGYLALIILKYLIAIMNLLIICLPLLIFSIYSMNNYKPGNSGLISEYIITITYWIFLAIIYRKIKKRYGSVFDFVIYIIDGM